MKTTLKRVLSIALALVLVVGVLPMGAMAYPHHGEHEDNDYDCRCDYQLYGRECEQPVHTMTVSVEELAATCTTDGYSAHMKCANCDHTDGRTIIPASHSMTVSVEAQAATCTTDGYSAHMKCANCDHTEGKEIIPASTVPHNFGKNEPVCKVCGVENDNYVKPVTVKFYVDGEKKETHTHNDGEITIQNLINNYCSVDDSVTLEYVRAEINYEEANLDTKVLPGQTAAVYLKTQTPPATSEPTTPPATSEPTTPPASTTTKYNVSYNLNVDETSKYNYPLAPREEGTRLATIMQELRAMEGTTIKFPGLFETWFEVEGWYVDGIKVTDNDTRALYSNTCFVAKWKQKYNYEVVLKLYTNGNTNTVVKVIDAFKYVQDDGKLSHTEVTKIANEYIKSNNDAPLTIYGPFDASGWEQYSLYSNRLTGTEYVTVNPNGTTVVHAMVHNALINGSSSTNNKKADSSNPKTGDMIMVPAAIMGTTVSALAVMFYLKKKRTV